MKSSILTIGDELLIGQVVNTNAGWLGQQLFGLGIPVTASVTVRDDEKDLIGGLKFLQSQCEVIITTGGLGPTADDKTREVLSKYLSKPLVFDPQVMLHVEGLFKSLNVPMNPINRSQAMVIEGCKVLHNPSGTAPGMHVMMEGKDLFILPGVPFEMKYLFEHHVAPIIRSKYELPILGQKTAIIEGIGESSLMGVIKTWEAGLANKEVSLAYLPSPGRVRLRLEAKGEDRTEVESRLEAQLKGLSHLIPEFYKGQTGDEAESRLGKMLTELGATIGTAESCTGGAIAQMISSVPGASDYFKGAIVAYSNAIKTDVLGVTPEVLGDHGAVSRSVVEQMAQGARIALNVDYAVAVSGIAGPDGGTPEKPIGTVWLAIATPKGVYSQLIKAGRSRSQIITRSTRKALTWMCDMLEREV